MLQVPDTDHTHTSYAPRGTDLQHLLRALARSILTCIISDRILAYMISFSI